MILIDKCKGKKVAESDDGDGDEDYEEELDEDDEDDKDNDTEDSYEYYLDEIEKYNSDTENLFMKESFDNQLV